MSVTVSDLMKLPCLSRARVLAGHNALPRIVTGLSVLEYSTPSDIQQQFFERTEFSGSELVLTGFCSIANDVDAQCMNIRRLAAAGEVGLILYYVGLFMPKVDQRLIDLANELNYVLICMPENDLTLRYSEVIQEVMDAVFSDSRNSHTFAVDVLEEMSRLPKSQQSVKTLLRILSDRLRANVLIADANYQALSAASWPRNQPFSWDALLERARRQPEESCLTDDETGLSFHTYRAELKTDANSPLLMFVFSEGGRPETAILEQAAESLRIGMGVWGKGHNRIDPTELLSAIIQDEPIKMRRLGSLYHIDVEALSDTWIIRSLRGEKLARLMEPVKEVAASYARIELCAEYENDIVLFPVGKFTLRDQEEMAAAITSFLKNNKLDAKLTRCPALQRTSDVKYAYELNCSYLRDAVIVFPARTTFSVSEVEFVKECRDIASAGRSSIRRYTSMLDRIAAGRDGAEILDTLACFLLDRNSSITETAAALFVHKNTVKYRLQKAGDLLGFRIGDIPQSKNLMYAIALRRLLDGLPA